jgi:hypothetical protein
MRDVLVGQLQKKQSSLKKRGNPLKSESIISIDPYSVIW